VHVNESSAAQGRDLPAVGGQFPTDGDSHHRASLSTLIVEALPTFIESTLGAPRDVDDTLVLASLLGHSQIGLTMNTYSHVIPDLRRDAASRMEELIQEKSR